MHANEKHIFIDVLAGYKQKYCEIWQKEKKSFYELYPTVRQQTIKKNENKSRNSTSTMHEKMNYSWDSALK